MLAQRFIDNNPLMVLPVGGYAVPRQPHAITRRAGEAEKNVLSLNGTTISSGWSLVSGNIIKKQTKIIK